MFETKHEPRLPLSSREYIVYRSAVQNFALACIYSANVLHENSLKAEVARPFTSVETGNIEEQLANAESNTALTDKFFGFVGLFHSLLGNHDVARVWAQHIKWPLKRFDALMSIAENEKSFGIDTKEAVQAAKYSLEVPIMTNQLKPELAARWARLALYANDIQKSPTVCLDIAKLILNSLHPSVVTSPPDEDLDRNLLYASVARAYLIIAHVEGTLGFDFESSLESAYKSVDEVHDLESAFDIFFEQKKADESFLGLIQIARSLAKQVKQRFDSAHWDKLEKVIMWVEQIKNADEGFIDFIDEDCMTIDQAQERLNRAKDSYPRWLALQYLIKAQVREGLLPTKALDEAEVLSSSFESGLQVRSLLKLAELAAEAGINPISYTDKARYIVYQRMVKSYKTGDMLREITKTEIEVARTLMRRCYPVLAQMEQVEVEALTREAIRLNDRDCIRALGAFLPRKVQDKFVSEETKNLLIAGRAMRGIW